MTRACYSHDAVFHFQCVLPVQPSVLLTQQNQRRVIGEGQQGAHQWVEQMFMVQTVREQNHIVGATREACGPFRLAAPRQGGSGHRVGRYVWAVVGGQIASNVLATRKGRRVVEDRFSILVKETI